MDGLSWFTTKHESLPSKLIKAGFDVYLGNDRGTRNSQRHTNLKSIKDAEKFAKMLEANYCREEGYFQVAKSLEKKFKFFEDHC